MLGRQVAILADGPFEAGWHEAAFDRSGLPSGTYLVRMTTDSGFAQTQRVTVVRWPLIRGGRVTSDRAGVAVTPTDTWCSAASGSASAV